jgi:hypothetical protein
MSRLAQSLLAAPVALACAGCFTVTGSFGAPIPLGHIDQIEPGVTTRDQITAWFGPPSAFYRPGLLELITGDGEELEVASAPVTQDVYSYRYVESRIRVLVIPLLVLRARGTSHMETLTVFFDDNGRVLDHGYRRDVPGEEIGAFGL